MPTPAQRARSHLALTRAVLRAYRSSISNISFRAKIGYAGETGNMSFVCRRNEKTLDRWTIDKTQIGDGPLPTQTGAVQVLKEISAIHMEVETNELITILTKQTKEIHIFARQGDTSRGVVDVVTVVSVVASIDPSLLPPPPSPQPKIIINATEDGQSMQLALSKKLGTKVWNIKISKKNSKISHSEVVDASDEEVKKLWRERTVNLNVLKNGTDRFTHRLEVQAPYEFWEKVRDLTHTVTWPGTIYVARAHGFKLEPPPKLRSLSSLFINSNAILYMSMEKIELLKEKLMDENWYLNDKELDENYIRRLSDFFSGYRFACDDIFDAWELAKVLLQQEYYKKYLRVREILNQFKIQSEIAIRKRDAAPTPYTLDEFLKGCLLQDYKPGDNPEPIVYARQNKTMTFVSSEGKFRLDISNSDAIAHAKRAWGELSLVPVTSGDFSDEHLLKLEWVE